MLKLLQIRLVHAHGSKGYRAARLKESIRREAIMES